METAFKHLEGCDKEWKPFPMFMKHKKVALGMNCSKGDLD